MNLQWERGWLMDLDKDFTNAVGQIDWRTGPHYSFQFLIVAENKLRTTPIIASTPDEAKAMAVAIYQLAQ
jgi:hypothetical protein